MTSNYSMQSSVARITGGPPHKEPDPRNKISRSHYKIFIKIDRNLLEMTQYNWQLLCAKRCGKIYNINFLGNWLLLGCNHSLTNSLLHYELKCLDWISVCWLWFGVVWVILIFLMRMNWCGYSLVLNHLQGYFKLD